MPKILILEIINPPGWGIMYEDSPCLELCSLHGQQLGSPLRSILSLGALGRIPAGDLSVCSDPETDLDLPAKGQVEIHPGARLISNLGPS